MLTVDVRRRGQIKKDAERILLQDGNFDDGLAFEHLAGARRLGFEEWRGGVHIDELRYGTNFELDVNARLLAGSKDDAFLYVPFESRSLNRQAVCPGTDIGHVIRA